VRDQAEGVAFIGIFFLRKEGGTLQEKETYVHKEKRGENSFRPEKWRRFSSLEFKKKKKKKKKRPPGSHLKGKKTADCEGG